MSGIAHEVYVVAVARTDGRLPGAEKILNSGFHLDRAAAEAEHRCVTDEIGPNFGLYQGLIAIQSRLDDDYVADHSAASRGLDLSGLKEEHLLALLADIYRCGATDARDDDVRDGDDLIEYLEEYVIERLTDIAQSDDDYTSRRDVGL
jgi:hypothetical protein